MSRVDSAQTGASVSEELLADVAQWYYLDDVPKTEIAERLGLSRFKVARLLTQARHEGVVTIEVRRPLGHDPALSDELRTALGLDDCVAVEVPRPDEASAEQTRQVVARAAARLLPSLVGDGDTLGLAWSRGVEAMVGELARLPRCELVQLCGAVHGPRGTTTTVDLMRRASELGGESPHVLHAPLVVEDAGAASSLRRQRGIADTLEMAGRLDLAVLAIGAWRPGCSTVWDVVDEGVRQAGTKAGAVTEAAGHLLDGQGRSLETPLASMLVGATLEQLRGTPRRLAIASGPDRAAAVVGAVRGGLVSSLVLTTQLARDVLRLLADDRDGT